MSDTFTRSTIRTIFWFTALGFAVRLGVRFYTGAEDFWTNGYDLLFLLAQNFAAGKGLTLDGVNPTAFRMPLYPVFLAAVTWGRQAFLPVVLAQALIGAGTVWCAALLAAEMFGAGAAVIAAGITAIYPYYAVHDTALQETSLFTLLTAVSVILLGKAARHGSGATALFAGCVLGADVLTRSTIAPFALLAPFWLIWAGGKGKLRTGLLCAGALTLTISPWLVRSYRLTEAATLNGEAGVELWNGNNALTFSHYPRESSDLSKAEALDALTPAERDAATDGWFARRAIEFMLENPRRTLGNGFRKLKAAFDWLPSPRRSLWPSLIYALSYGPMMLLGLRGIWLRRARWREDALIYALFVSFAAVTAVFFGHTSHRAYLDVYLIVFAAGALDSFRRRYFKQSRAIRVGA